MQDKLVDPWLVAIWPGMGNVGITAGKHLHQELGAEILEDLSACEYFEIEKVDIQQGVARVGWMPSCTLYGWKNPSGGRDLLIFTCEAQPSQRGYEFCRHLLQVAKRYRVARVFTFAAMATQMHPSSRPRVLGVTNEATLIGDLTFEGVETLNDGQISGLNGVMLVAAADENVEAMCLLGEIPFFAASVPNPKAAVRVLRVFTRMAGFRVDLSALERQAKSLESQLIELFDRMNIASVTSDEDSEEPNFEVFSLPDFLEAEDEESALEIQDKSRIEDLFDEAAKDRAKAPLLKQELDRMGAFQEYEDRFLDLFRPRNG